MSRPNNTYRANGAAIASPAATYEPARATGKTWPAERKGKQEAARRLRQMAARAERVAS